MYGSVVYVTASLSSSWLQRLAHQGLTSQSRRFEDLVFRGWELGFKGLGFFNQGFRVWSLGVQDFGLVRVLVFRVSGHRV